jgi:hypothetical protein
MKPSDLPEGSKVEVTVEDGKFAAYFFFDQHSRMYDGYATGSEVEEAIIAALADVE